jgi:hypothetical protein
LINIKVKRRKTTTQALPRVGVACIRLSLTGVTVGIIINFAADILLLPASLHPFFYGGSFTQDNGEQERLQQAVN